MRAALSLLLVLLDLSIVMINSECSSRTEAAIGAASERLHGEDDDGGFYLEVSGAPSFYHPGGLYTVSLRVSMPDSVMQRYTKKAA